MVCSSESGGDDRCGCTFARHLKNHIPGVLTGIVRNLPGAGSLKAVL
jgi:hypothetical protein